jgi:hypothetical protein
MLRRDLGNEWGIALALNNVATAELQLGRLSSAAANVRIALETSVRVGREDGRSGLPGNVRVDRSRVRERARGGAAGRGKRPAV